MIFRSTRKVNMIKLIILFSQVLVIVFLILYFIIGFPFNS